MPTKRSRVHPKHETRHLLIFGDWMRARGADAQSVEARLACGMLNRMTDLGQPKSFAIKT